MTLGEKIKTQRKLLHLTQADLAEKVGVSRRVIISYETNKTQPRTGTGLSELARALNVNVDYLTTDCSNSTHDSSDFSKLLVDLLDEFSPVKAENNYTFDELNRWQRTLQYLLDNCPSLSNDNRIMIGACLCNIFYSVGNYSEAQETNESSLEDFCRSKPKISELASSTSFIVPTINNSTNLYKADETQETLLLFAHLLFSSISIAIRFENIEKAQERLKETNTIIQHILLTATKDETVYKRADEFQIALYSKMATLCRKAKEFDRGIEYAKKAIEQRLRFDNPGRIILDPLIDYQGLDHTSELAEYFSTLGYVLLGKGISQPDESQITNLEEAIKNLKRGLDIRKKISIYHPLLARSYHNIGRAYIELLQLVSTDDNKYAIYKQEAESNINKALEIKKNDAYPNEDSLAIEYINLGRLYKYIGQSEKNIDYIKRSRDCFNRCLQHRADIYSEGHNKIQSVKAQLEELTELELSFGETIIV